MQNEIRGWVGQTTEKRHHLYEDLAAISGSRHVMDQEWAIEAVSRDNSIEGELAHLRPDIIVRPGSEEEVIEIVKLANETKTPIIPTGARTSCGGASLPKHGGINIDLLRMNKIEVHEEYMVYTVGPGVVWSHLHDALYKKGFKSGFKGPYSLSTATVVGSVSSNSHGIYSAKWGGAPDHVLCIKAVTSALGLIGTGSLSNKNAKAYFRYCNGPDLTGILIGDHGTMGVKTEITMKMYLWPEAIEYQTNIFTERESAIKSFSEKLKTGYMDDSVLVYYVKDFIRTILPDLSKSAANIGCIEYYVVEDKNQGVADAKMKALDKITKKYRGVKMGATMGKLMQEEIGSTGMVVAMMAKMGPWVLQCHARPVDDLLRYSEKCDEQYERSGYEKKGFSRQGQAFGIGRGQVSVIDNLFNPFSDPEVIQLTEKYATEGKNHAVESGGCPYWLGPAWYDHVYENYTPEYIAYYKAVKRVLDPNNIMNPGAFNIEELD